MKIPYNTFQLQFTILWNENKILEIAYNTFFPIAWR